MISRPRLVDRIPEEVIITAEDMKNNIIMMNNETSLPSKKTPKPTYLMVKWHPIDPSRRKDHKGKGLFYFCKTTGKNSLAYKGSGDHWKAHIKKHGKHLVETLWHKLFTNGDQVEIALLFSKQQDIVKSKLWSNQKEENGLDGGSEKGQNKGKKNPDTSKRMKGNTIGKGKKYKPWSEERKNAKSNAMKGKPSAKKGKKYKV